jgi:ATP-dependent Clp protease ATP-binding subunit ClpA/post-segregation antitoxin (ccd killing protein)
MVPKINVYLPDELAEAVKEAGLPVSAICQRALESAVARVTSIRETVVAAGALRDGLDDRAGFEQLTQRARTVLAVAIDHAATSGSPVTTAHLLSAMLAEGENLALRVLRSMEIEPDDLARNLAARTDPAGVAAGPVEPSFDEPTQTALRLAATEATSLGHNYVGTEHLLLGLVAEPDGAAGHLLRSAGADLRLTRRAVGAALAGYAHLQANAAAKQGGADMIATLTAAIDRQLAPIVARLDRLEERYAE